MCGRIYIRRGHTYIFRILLIHKSGEIFKFSAVHFWEFIPRHVNIKYKQFQNI